MLKPPIDFIRVFDLYDYIFDKDTSLAWVLKSFQEIVALEMMR